MPAFDVIIIGSGFGGAVAACRLAEKDMKVLVLERGRRWDTYPYGPRKPEDAWLWNQRSPERANGWLDFRCFKNMCVAQCAGVGGGSLIYANISINAKPELFQNGWPMEISYDELAPYYEKVSQMLRPVPVPEKQIPARFRLMKEAASKMGYEKRFRPLDLAVTFNADLDTSKADSFDETHSKEWVNSQGAKQGTCIHCGNCVIGCPVRAKNTLDLNYLAKAEKQHAEIRELHVVRFIEPFNGHYRVVFDRIVSNGTLQRGEEKAHRVVVAAGSLGSTELLLRCRDEYKTLPNLSRFLGYNWSSNGDFLTPALYADQAISPTHGPTITSAIDFLDGSADGEQVFIEDGGFPDFVGQILLATTSKPGRNPMLRAISSYLRPYIKNRDAHHCVMPWFGQSVDAADGRLLLRRHWCKPWERQLRLDWDISRSEKVINAMVNMHRRLSEATGGIPLIPPTWSIFKTLITPHPLGGCNMGTTQADGVVDHKGAVFGYKNLYVADGAIVPQAIGLNPSKTIAALAERSAALMQ
ncbi:MAG TPA: GMC family oxidoreductase [Anaerolineales bacterium]|nr:GMC family oxidoreductase [Anaerolineales bacterium]